MGIRITFLKAVVVVVVVIVVVFSLMHFLYLKAIFLGRSILLSINQKRRKVADECHLGKSDTRLVSGDDPGLPCLNLSLAESTGSLLHFRCCSEFVLRRY